MQKQLQAGDIVELKSGGPRMTVTSATETDAIVTWIDASGAYTSTFPIACLVYISGASDDQPPHPK